MITKLFPAIPDVNLRGSQEREKALPRFAHLNVMIDELNTLLAGPGNGTAGTNVVAEETGIGESRTTKLTLSNFVVGALGGALADLALGGLVYTLPAGAQNVELAYMSVGLTAVGTAATPDVGIGTTQGSGAVATLDLVGAAAENIITGQTAADISGTVTEISSTPDLLVASGGDKTIYLNAADGWAADNTGNLTADGIIVLKWTILV